MGENLEALLNSWASSPTAGRLRPSEDGLEAGHDFLGDFNMELLLAPSPPPPPAAAPPPVEDSTGSGTAGGAPQSSAPMSAPPAASPAGPGGSGLGAALGHQQQAALGQQQGAQVHAHHSLHHAMPAYMRPLTASGSAPLPPLDPSAAAQLGGPQPMMLQLPPNGSGMQHYMAPPRNYHQPGTGPPLVLPALTAVPAGSSQQPSESNLDGKRRRGPRPRVFKKHTCQSDGCTVDLAPLSFYLQRNHICPDHLKADSYMVKGVPSRFCQRCGQGHPLTEFEGSKRSCRKALERHNQRRWGGALRREGKPWGSWARAVRFWQLWSAGSGADG
ncbi:hypothetical protein CHLNCDRAFT_37677 [Chlorella variabilis]|uniref:SBP-type domain-containing protein n=1 Tax=Chlorella variabilis TaxID=554065 RepID=E1ZTM8_CHLVA|nr:hypothetical protein CHLNCDRAFT_37677 [Chlorella variabilis]EFN50836.1 hypothetical protein CHLNCDRAFT_37677 [Chlorella variabilis]|eukprot:XP_005842938.1 hypothetical protein CHLNCDRAFT_37677 [Chlorella variabilis]